jgi:hypothetical protein
MDYWSFEMILLEIYSPEYLQAHFPINNDLIDKLKRKKKQVEELVILEQIRQAYTE